MTLIFGTMGGHCSLISGMQFCGINFCGWHNLEDFAELLFAISITIVNISYVLTLLRGVFCCCPSNKFFLRNFCGWQNPKDCAELIFAIFAKFAKINSARIRSAKINDLGTFQKMVQKCALSAFARKISSFT